MINEKENLPDVPYLTIEPEGNIIEGKDIPPESDMEVVSESVSSEGYQVKNYKLKLPQEDPEKSKEEKVDELLKELDNTPYVPRMNREQRRALAKKAGKAGRAQLGTISETAKKLFYVNLIQELRKLNEEKENENEQTVEEGNT